VSHSDRSQNRIRNGWTIILVGVVVASSLLSGCAPAPKVYRVGILFGMALFASTTEGFKEKMTELGYVEGKNIVYDIQEERDAARQEQILKKFVDDKVDLIFVFPTNVALAAKAATAGTDVPVLFANSNIEGVDLVKSVREPGGNITGVRYPGPDLTVKRFEILHELVPQAKRIWVPRSTLSQIVPAQMEALRPAAEAAGVTLVETPAANAAELQADLDARAKSADIGIDAILAIAEPLTGSPDTFAVIAKFAAEHKLPMGGVLMSTEGYSTLFGVSTDNVAVGKQAAPLADKILKGIPAGTIPVASAESYFQLNYKAAQEQGVTVPEGLLGQANQVIR
jgi:putative ABC transport system substrate-binding protein